MHLQYSGVTEQIFTDVALDEIHRFSGGAARIINKICTHCLLYGAQNRHRIIDDHMVKRVIEGELSWNDNDLNLSIKLIGEATIKRKLASPLIDNNSVNFWTNNTVNFLPFWGASNNRHQEKIKNSYFSYWSIKFQLNKQENQEPLKTLNLNSILQKSTYLKPLYLSTCCIVKRIMNLIIHSQYPLPTIKFHLIFNNFCLYLWYGSPRIIRKAR